MKFKKDKINRIKKDSSQPYTQSSLRPERAFPGVLASLTIEASLILPLFLFFTVCIIHFLILLSLQADIQVHAEEAARAISRRAYVADEEDLFTVVNTNPLTIKAQMLDSSLSSRLNASQVLGGADGLHTILSTYDEETGLLDVVVTYTYVFPYLPKSIGSVNFIQRCYTRAWIGKELKESSVEEGAAEGTDEKIVYITPTGTVYHLSPSCPYLDLSIRAVSRESLRTIRSLDGSIYGKCHCVTSANDYVYVTNYGVMYHSDPECSSLKRTVMAVTLSEAGSRKACSKCGGKH